VTARGRKKRKAHDLLRPLSRDLALEADRQIARPDATARKPRVEPDANSSRRLALLQPRRLRRRDAHDKASVALRPRVRRGRDVRGNTAGRGSPRRSAGIRPAAPAIAQVLSTMIAASSPTPRGAHEERDMGIHRAVASAALSWNPRRRPSRSRKSSRSATSVQGRRLEGYGSIRTGA